jgi:16S rRNA (adenine1518-N6/adenine1519-N6)-dimethyltransferase
VSNDIGLSELPPLREVIAAHNLSARKSLGQNFLLDLNITRRITAAADIPAKTTVMEIGPGPGGLTRALLEAGTKKVIAVERDERCVAALSDIREIVGERLEIISADALELQTEPLVSKHGPLQVVANLPYNIATPLLINWLRDIEHFSGFVLMFQSEVADRIIASPGSKAYGRLSVATQWRCETKPLFRLSPNAFVPPPRVASTVVKLTPREKPVAEAGPELLEKVVAAAFAQRRKMLRAVLKGTFSDPISVLEAVGIDPTARAETIDIEGFCALARSLEKENTSA